MTEVKVCAGMVGTCPNKPTSHIVTRVLLRNGVGVPDLSMVAFDLCEPCFEAIDDPAHMHIRLIPHPVVTFPVRT